MNYLGSTSLLGGPEIELHEGKYPIMQDFHHYRLQALNHEGVQFHEAGGFEVYKYMST